MKPLIYGEVLFDCFPDGSRVLGGAPFNVAWHLHAFGGEPLLVSGVGDDPAGREILAAMERWGMAVAGVHLDTGRATGSVEVRFVDGEPHYEIVDDRAWDLAGHGHRTDPDARTFLYHGSLALRHAGGRQQVDRLRRTAATVFVDINLRPPWYQHNELIELIKGIDWLKLNRDELAIIVPDYHAKEDRVRYLLNDLNVGHIVLSEGEKGGTLYMADEQPLHVPVVARSSVVDVVGAGDSFSAVLILGILRGWPLETGLRRAQEFASAIVTVRGATVDDPTFYKEFIESWNLNPA